MLKYLVDDGKPCIFVFQTLIMKSAYQITWYGIEKYSNKITNVAKLPKALKKGALSVFHIGGVMLTPFKKDAQIIKDNYNKRGCKDSLIFFTITDKQFGMISQSFGKPAELTTSLTHTITAKEGNRNIAIPVTAKQLQSKWIDII